MGTVKMDKLLKQAQRMQAQMATLQEELGKVTLEGTSGGGMVRATVNGHGDLMALKIAPEVVDPKDPEMLEDLVLTAVRGAQELARETAAKEMQKLTAGLNLPPGFGF